MPARWWSFKQGNPLELPFPVAAKTGTSQDFRDNYVIGYSTKKVVGVWAGNTDGTPMNTSSGIEGAGKTWHTVMQILHDEAPSPFTYNSARTRRKICRKPEESLPNCSEQYVEFLLPNEINSSETLSQNTNTFSISYPGNGDIFHPESPILIDVRNIENENEVEYFLDGTQTNQLIDKKLTSGKHTISAKTKNAEDKIIIFVAE